MIFLRMSNRLRRSDRCTGPVCGDRMRVLLRPKLFIHVDNIRNAIYTMSSYCFCYYNIVGILLPPNNARPLLPLLLLVTRLCHLHIEMHIYPSRSFQSAHVMHSWPPKIKHCWPIYIISIQYRPLISLKIFWSLYIFEILWIFCVEDFFCSWFLMEIACNIVSINKWNGIFFFTGILM